MRVFFRLHAEGHYGELVERLEPALAVGQVVYEAMSESGAVSADQGQAMAARIYLESLALAGLAQTQLQWAEAKAQASSSSMVFPVEGIKADLIGRASMVMNTLQLEGDFSQQMWFVHCQAMVAYSQGHYESARQYWFRLRQAASADSDQAMLVWYWWEGRLFGLYSLLGGGECEQVSHIVEVIESSRTDIPDPWAGRLKALRVLSEGLCGRGLTGE